jgi:maltooligosyltrehalose trehalohydrolase
MERSSHFRQMGERIRRLPVGAEVLAGGGVHFRVWAPRRRKVEVIIESGPGYQQTGLSHAIELNREAGGYFSGVVPAAADKTFYRYRLDAGGDLFPDPASRFQPEGPHGSSQVVDPGKFRWTDGHWLGTALPGQIIYEMHIGTFTPEGTWNAACALLPQLAETGVTLLEVMPIADFSGSFGWGYDGVDLFAPTRLYGTPDDFREFVNRAHTIGIGVILDVVYNHMGSDGCYVSEFSEDYFTNRHETDWGPTLNFEGENSGPVREFVLSNVSYWIEEFHLDGLRLDATQNIYDRSSAEHILAAISRRVRESAQGRLTVVVAENEQQHAILAQPIEQDGYGIDALWNDDFHHTAMVALTGHNEAYYTDYLGTPQEFISAIKWGYLYQGQRYSWQRARRGTPCFGLKPDTFITFIQNHDQIANSSRGDRIHLLTSPGRYRAMTALMLLAPGTPMLFQGQEFAASSPFLYFADYKTELREYVKKGRHEFLRQFRSLALQEMQDRLADPTDPQTFNRCKLDMSECRRHTQAYALHRDLLNLRRKDPVFHSQRQNGVDGAVLGQAAFVLRFFGDRGDDRLLVINFGRDLHLDPAPEPLLAPPTESVWEVLWCSEDPDYGGDGTPSLDTEENWKIPGEAAVALIPKVAGKGQVG